jgi:heat shock protein HslJ
MKRMIIVIIITLMLLSACASQTSLVDTKWQVVNLDGETALEGVTVTMNFSKDSIGGSDGCNSYGGSYTATKSTIRFGSDLFSTEMYCTEEIMTQSTAFYNVLGQVTDYKADSQLLTLFNADGKKLAELIPVQE